MPTFGPIDAVSEHLEPAERRATAILSEALCRGGAEIAQIGPDAPKLGVAGPKGAVRAETAASRCLTGPPIRTRSASIVSILLATILGIRAFSSFVGGMYPLADDSCIVRPVVNFSIGILIPSVIH